MCDTKGDLNPVAEWTNKEKKIVHENVTLAGSEGSEGSLVHTPPPRPHSRCRCARCPDLHPGPPVAVAATVMCVQVQPVKALLAKVLDGGGAVAR